MARSLVIVESPAKAKTINKYLGRNYTVKASYGHVMDLPRKELGINIKRGFEPTYEISPDKTHVVEGLRKAAQKAEAIYLAADPDREGEAICAHLAEVLKPTMAAKNGSSGAGKKKKRKPRKGQEEDELRRNHIFRVMFNEITPRAIRAAFEHPGEINENLVDAQQARRVLDRLVGYKISPLLWDKVRRGLSAGRVQTVAVRLIVEREREIRAFTPVEYWTLHAQLAAAEPTMALAQRLYEGVELGEEGSVALITYMRTDSVRVSNEALGQVRELIGTEFGPNYLPEKPNFYKSKKEAQDAHEAIRPTDVARKPADVKRYLSDDLFKLYQLIWQRFVASQMLPAVFDQTSIDISAGDYLFRATGSVMKFDGYLAAYQISTEREDDEAAETDEGRRLPPVTEGEVLRLETLRPDQHFTEPPPRYSEATLVKELEDKGIGRPSTYASIISTIVEREYVNKDQGRFTPTMLGEKVSDLLVKSFEDIFDVSFTARMEEELDEIEEGRLRWKRSVSEFWEKFELDLDKAEGEMESYKAGIPTGLKCEKCGEGELLERISRHGFFLGCSRYPECDFTKDLSPEVGGEEVESESTVEYCENCGKEMAIKRGKWGPFLACTGYPECKTTRRLVTGTRKARKPDEPLDEKCPECGSGLVKKHGRYGEFIGCSGYPKCKYTRPITLGIKCPKCGTGEFVRRGSAKGRGRTRIFYGCSRYPECDFTTPHQPIAEPCPKCGAAFIVEKKTKTGTVRACLKEGCDWEMEVHEAQPVEAAEAVPVKF